jgi:hypothetical protein
MTISAGISSVAAPDDATLEGTAAGGAATEGKLAATRMIADAAARKYLIMTTSFQIFDRKGLPGDCRLFEEKGAGKLAQEFLVRLLFPGGITAFAR